MIHEYEINGIPVKTGDLICTHDGGAPILEGQFWRFVGNLVPGDVDHVAVYIGPDGRCVEAGVKGVISYDVANKTWDSQRMESQRGPIIDTFYGVAYPLEGRNLADSKKTQIRESVATYCLAQVGKHYNLNFLDSKTEERFYCSQLAYLAYLKNGIDLNKDHGVPRLPGMHGIVFPQEVWSECAHRKV